MMKKRIYLATTISAALAVVLVVCACLCFSDKAVYLEGRRQKAVPQQTDANFSDEFGFVPADRPSVVPISAERRAELKAIYDNLVVAYSNSQHEIIAEWEDRIPAMVANLPDKDFNGVESEFYRALFDEFRVNGVALRGFTDVGEFAARIRTDFAAVRLFEKTCQKRGCFGQFGAALEARVLKRLNGYREKFASEGMPDLARTADRFVAEWIDQIESSRGFSRMVALSWMEVWKKNRNDAHGSPQSWESLRDKAIMQGAEHLIKIGYNPKWAEELRKMPESALR